MAEEIINRVANSSLITIDLEDFYPSGNRVLFDIKNWLYEGLILREKDFREHVKNHDWSQHQDNYVALTCSSDAIIPSWAYLLLSTQLAPFAKKVVVGNLELLETVVYQEIINNLNISEYDNKPVIIKGCTNKPIPASAYTLLIEKIQPVAKTIMFGEACSTVPLYKKKK
ncbi:hypothetical protein WH52_04330 [Tenacibaculum holothuriorum]|uniref:DUF2480 family protein n=1 Tax=Tenacibaculum holothuriorum TaxID=1635173 RepID=A0A1Y2PGG8_9FLAO|nr:DUF2480 family protein [Tenacibaculum holothuriorum]OSY88897.1 hypothetical protein WH52_04330 [Tenacibaculum holothuriorum]